MKGLVFGFVALAGASAASAAAPDGAAAAQQAKASAMAQMAESMPDGLTLVLTISGFGATCLVARKRAARRDQWESAVGKLSGRVRA